MTGAATDRMTGATAGVMTGATTAVTGTEVDGTASSPLLGVARLAAGGTHHGAPHPAVTQRPPPTKLASGKPQGTTTGRTGLPACSLGQGKAPCSPPLLLVETLTRGTQLTARPGVTLAGRTHPTCLPPHQLGDPPLLPLPRDPGCQVPPPPPPPLVKNDQQPDRTCLGPRRPTRGPGRSPSWTTATSRPRRRSLMSPL